MPKSYHKLQLMLGRLGCVIVGFSSTVGNCRIRVRYADLIAVLSKKYHEKHYPLVNDRLFHLNVKLTINLTIASSTDRYWNI